ncbi:hypothetical protein [Prolixibacter denitrificans]|uniref:VOC domain-containing protein n=1 Tax=Prolixibacter denitrificans TaxID=1541063 RepID=A0A2P8CKI0_9BACT|nr:hypothetical protein [Prolixibacter denitrificans]PSK85474.1 hypothetical protein CLV93_101430 [Prolixibacter denitrificans]GET20094.1 hypothetical protein JCM18694_03400 [Prolixibacter denitrificans]
MKTFEFRYHHLGIPTKEKKENEVYHEGLKFFHSGYESSEFGIEWMRFEDDSPMPELVKTVPHVAFVVHDMDEALKGRNIIVEPNSPSEGILVAMIEENGAPVEFLRFTSPDEGRKTHTSMSHG